MNPKFAQETLESYLESASNPESLDAITFALDVLQAYNKTVGYCVTDGEGWIYAMPFPGPLDEESNLFNTLPNLLVAARNFRAIEGDVVFGSLYRLVPACLECYQLRAACSSEHDLGDKHGSLRVASSK